MRTVILVRHGDYDRDTGEVKPDSMGRLRMLSAQLSNLFQGKVAEVHCSTALRAIQTAEVLVRDLHVGYTREAMLFVPGDEEVTSSQMAACRAIIEDSQADIVVFITHNPMIYRVQSLVGYIFGIHMAAPVDVCPGQALVLDEADRAFNVIP